MTKKVEVERRDAVTVLTINRPEVHNAVDGETAEMITEAIEAFATVDGARVLVVTGAGGKAFCSGADLRDAGSLLARPDAERTGPMGFSSIDPGKPIDFLMKCLPGIHPIRSVTILHVHPRISNGMAGAER